MVFGYLQLKTRHYTILLDRLTEEQNLGHLVNVIKRPLWLKSEKNWSKFLILVMLEWVLGILTLNYRSIF